MVIPGLVKKIVAIELHIDFFIFATHEGNNPNIHFLYTCIGIYSMQ